MTDTSEKEEQQEVITGWDEVLVNELKEEEEPKINRLVYTKRDG
jgi:hypothetical protein